MFGRIKESIRILSHKEETIHPDTYEEAGSVSYVDVSRAGRAIAGIISGAVAIFIGFMSYRVVDAIIPKGHLILLSSKGASGILTAVFSLVVFWIFENMKNDLASRLNLKYHLAPYFGHKISNALRIVRN